MKRQRSESPRESILREARRVLEIEAEAIAALIPRLDERFAAAVELLEQCRGRVVVCGMGKSGLIGKKIAATLASTGTPAFFLHPAEGIHGDLGMLSRGDLVIAISNSGETEEILRVIPALKRLEVPLIVLTGNPNSTLARHSDVTLDVSVEEEATAVAAVPTASTTATLALGDAIAVALLGRRGFREEDFAVIHPGGTLGRRLLLRVEDAMHHGSQMPVVAPDTPMRQVIVEMTSKRLGITTVQDTEKRLVGVITDGDLRRLMQREADPFRLRASEVMTPKPKTIRRDELAARALGRMEGDSITALVVVDQEGRVEGIVHLHDLLKLGIA